MKRVVFIGVFTILIHVLFSFSEVAAQDGKALFQQKCASCHGIDKDLTGPALKGMEERAGSKELLYRWIRNNKEVLASGNKYYNDLYEKWNKAAMTLYPDLTDADLDAICKYIAEWAPPVKPQTKAKKDAGSEVRYVVWALVALVAVWILFYIINSRLRAMAEEAQGVRKPRPIPFYRRKKYIALACVFAVMGIAYNMVDMGISVGRDDDYMPRQPVFFSHKVHAGVNQIQCQFCHTGVDKSKVAGLPTLQTCMTCHMAVDSYKGEELYTEEGTLIDADAEIRKLYAFAGWNPQTKSYDKPPQAVEWVRLHSLPDHVFFSHEQHVQNGQLNCAQCHGDVGKMDEMRQVSSLSMSWCVNCHRNTEVPFTENAYFGMYEQLHKDLKEGKIKSVNAHMLGANECQKCHY